MKKNQKYSKGITLVSLVITIILLIILAGISIQAITNTGLFEAAGRAKKEAKRAQIVEWLNLKLIEEQSYNPIGTSEQIINATKVRVENNKSELEKIGKPVTVEETKTEEDGEQVDIYFYVQVEKDVFKVEIKGAQFIGEAGKFPPIIKLDSITPTTNSIIVQVSTKRNEGGKIEYYIKAEDEEKYTLKETTTTDGSYTFEGLEQKKNYNIKIVAIAENKQTAEVTQDILLGGVTDLEQADIIFTYEPNDVWTSGNVKVTAALKEGITITSSYTLKITDSDPTVADNATAKGWADASTGISVSSNKQVFAVLIDSAGQIGTVASGNVQKIDTVAPTISTALSSTDKTTNSVTLSIGVTDENSGLGKIEWYYGTTDNPTTLADTTKVTDLNGSEAGPTTAQTKTTTLTGLTPGATYFFKAIVYDVAGKTTTSSVIKVTIDIPTAAEIQYTPLDKSWEVNNVKAALDALY